MTHPTPDLSPEARIEIKHRYTGEILHTVQADTLAGANLCGANLWGADLRGARIADYVVTALVAQLQRSSGHAVSAFATEDGQIVVCAGCWVGTLAEARAHKADADYASADENSAICDFVETRARQLGLMPARAALENKT